MPDEPGPPAPTNAEVRAWARAQGLTVADRGRLPAAVVAAYAQAHEEQPAAGIEPEPAPEPAQAGRSGRSRRRLAVAGLVLGGLAVVALVLVLLVLPDDRASDGDVAFEDLRVGDCLSEIAYGELSTTVPVEPCTEPHAGEVFATFDLDGEAFPGDVEVGRLAESGCDRRLEDAQLAADLTLYEITTFTPTEGSWAAGDRVVHCLLATTDGSPTTGSLRRSTDG